MALSKIQWEPGYGMMPKVEKRLDRIKATVAGAMAGLMLAVLAALLFVALFADGNAYYARQGLTPAVMIIIALPGTLTIGSIVAFPTSAAMVWFTTSVSKKLRIFDTAPIWIASGVVFAAPTAYAFSTMQPGLDQFAPISLWSFFLMVGGGSGLAAWAFRHSNVGPIIPSSPDPAP